MSDTELPDEIQDARDALRVLGVEWRTQEGLAKLHALAEQDVSTVRQLVGVFGLIDTPNELPFSTNQTWIHVLLRTAVETVLFPDSIPGETDTWETLAVIWDQYMASCRPYVLTGAFAISKGDPWSIRKAVQAAWNIEFATVGCPIQIGPAIADSAHRGGLLCARDLWIEFKLYADQAMDEPSKRADFWDAFMSRWSEEKIRRQCDIARARLASERAELTARFGFEGASSVPSPTATASRQENMGRIFTDNDSVFHAAQNADESDAAGEYPSLAQRGRSGVGRSSSRRKSTMTRSRAIAVLREALPRNPAKLEALIALADEHIGNCQDFYHRVRLLQKLQLDILKPIAESDAPYRTMIEANRDREIKRLIGHNDAYHEYVQSKAAKKTTCPKKELLRYLNLEGLHCSEDYVEAMQSAQASLFAAGIGCRNRHDVLLDLASDPDLPDAALDEPTRGKISKWEAECDLLIAYYRAWRDREVEFVRAFIAECKRQLAKYTAPKLTVDEANRKAMELAEADPQFVRKPQREWAKLIGCAAGQVTKLPLWREVARATGRDRKGKPKVPRVVSLTEKVLAVTSDSGSELDRLVAEQRADSEPSPLEEHGPKHGVRNRKKL